MSHAPVSHPNAATHVLEQEGREIVGRLRESGFVALWAGGCVRDRLLGTQPKDIDIATSATPDEVLALFPRSAFVGHSFGVARVAVGDLAFELATFRQDGVYLDGRHPEQVTFTTDPAVDARRRDFTVNALFYDPIEDRILDSVGGLADLEARVIRAVGNPVDRFREDRLRLLRAIRFASQLDFSIEPATWKALCQETPAIGEISAERIRDELVRMLTQPRADIAFRLLDESGLLAHILPEVVGMKGVDQPPEYHPEGDVFVHTLLLLKHLDHPTPELALAALFHDVGKPDTFEIADRIRFNGHDKLGAEMFERVADRLRLPNRQTERVRDLIADHMRIGHVKKMRPAKLKRFLRADHFPELLELHRLDCLASHADTELYDFCQVQLAELSQEELKPAPLLTGNDLIQLGFTPGPSFREILTEVEDRQLEGELESREAAVEYVRAHYHP